jgi:hypothetical protein
MKILEKVDLYLYFHRFADFAAGSFASHRHAMVAI